MSANTMFGLLFDRVSRRPGAVHQAARQLHRGCHGGPAQLRPARGRRLEGASLSPLRDRCGRGDVAGSEYAIALLLFNVLGAVVVYALQRLQALPAAEPAEVCRRSAPDSAFNTAVSFVTNTNWQGYAGESTMSYLTQMAGLAVQNFLSAATGIAVAIALIRGFARHSAPDDRQLLGRRHARDALHPAAAVAAPRAGARRPGRRFRTSTAYKDATHASRR